MDYRWSRVKIFFITDPHLLKSGQRCQNGAPDPHRILSLGRGHDFKRPRHGRGGDAESFVDFRFESDVEAGEKRGAAGQDYVGIKFSAQVDVALLNGLVSDVVNAWRLDT